MAGKSVAWRYLAAAGLLLLSVSAGARQPVPCDQSSGPIGCIDVTLSPATLAGDIYLDGRLIVPQVYSTRLNVAPDAVLTVEVKNLTDTAAGFGDLFVYDDASQANLRVAAGQIRVIVPI